MELFTNIKLNNLGLLCVMFGFIVAPHIITGTTITITRIFSSCTTTELVNPQLPHLSFAKASSVMEYNAKCNDTGEFSGFTINLSWYSYSLSPPANCCANSTCHTVDVSTFVSNATAYSVVGSNVIITHTGLITNGPYSTHPFNWEIATPVSNQLACTTPAGLEIVAGTNTVVITNGPSCTGIHMEEYCPGLHIE